MGENKIFKTQIVEKQTLDYALMNIYCHHLTFRVQVLLQT